MSKFKLSYEEITAGLEYWTALDEKTFPEAADHVHEQSPVLSGYMLSVGDEMQEDSARMLYFYYCILASAFFKKYPEAALVSQREIDKEEARLHQVSEEMEKSDEDTLARLLHEEQKEQPAIFEFIEALMDEDPDEELFSPFAEEARGMAYATLSLAVNCMHRSAKSASKLQV